MDGSLDTISKGRYDSFPVPTVEEKFNKANLLGQCDKKFSSLVLFVSLCLALKLGTKFPRRPSSGDG